MKDRPRNLTLADWIGVTTVVVPVIGAVIGGLSALSEWQFREDLCRDSLRAVCRAFI